MSDEKKVAELAQVEKCETDPDVAWDELLRKVVPSGDSSQDAAWDNAVAGIPREDVQQRLDAQRFLGQGQ